MISPAAMKSPVMPAASTACSLPPLALRLHPVLHPPRLAGDGVRDQRYVARRVHVGVPGTQGRVGRNRPVPDQPGTLQEAHSRVDAHSGDHRSPWTVPPSERVTFMVPSSPVDLLFSGIIQAYARRAGNTEKE